MLSRPEIEMKLRENGITGNEILKYGVEFCEHGLRLGMKIGDLVGDLKLLQKHKKLSNYKQEAGHRFDDADLRPLQDGKIRGCGMEFDPDKYLKRQSVTGSKAKLESVSESFAGSRKT